MGAAVFSAIAAVIVRKIGHEERSAVLLLYPMMANFVLMGCAMPFVYHAMPALHLGGTALMALLGFVAALCHHRRLPPGSAVVVAPMQYSQILWAVLYGFVFFGETPTAATAIGAAIIIASGIYVVFREDTATSRGPGRCSGPRPATSRGTYPRISSASAGCSPPRQRRRGFGRPRPRRSLRRHFARCPPRARCLLRFGDLRRNDRPVSECSAAW